MPTSILMLANLDIHISQYKWPHTYRSKLCDRGVNTFLCVALMKLNDDDLNALQVLAAIFNAFLWGLMVVLPFVQVS